MYTAVADIKTKEARSYNMSRIRCRNTKPEEITHSMSFSLIIELDSDADSAELGLCLTGFYATLEDTENTINIEMHIPGHHNVLNGLAAFAVCDNMGVSADGIKDALEKFTGAGRRFEFLGEYNGFTLADDYAHHPTEINATLTAAKHLDYNRVIAVFQPFTFSRTALLKDEFIEALSVADKVILTPIMGSREVNTYGIKSEHLAEKLSDAIIVDGFENIADAVIKEAKAGDLVITMGGGDIYKAERIRVECAQRAVEFYIRLIKQC